MTREIKHEMESPNQATHTIKPPQRNSVTAAAHHGGGGEGGGNGRGSVEEGGGGGRGMDWASFKGNTAAKRVAMSTWYSTPQFARTKTAASFSPSAAAPNAPFLSESLAC